MWFLWFLAGFALVTVPLSWAAGRGGGPHRHVPPARLSRLASMSWREQGRP